MLTSGVGATPATSEVRDLHLRYADYRRRHAARLVHLMPREAVRPLYRLARMESDGSEDPLELLVAYCERLMPLPPFEVWCTDLMASPEAHLADWDDSADAPTPQAPSTVEVRSVIYHGRTWLARLKSYREGGVWRGYIAFADAEAGHVHRTAPVFREGDPVALRDRFLSFEPVALEAFLRSALP
jgi:hypothetical protein